ncbi:unnamed protein product [Owenia fusiformis]|uniref:Uncharacterized protein n=1 Tax=Owenia fusiformis TaxID=6347 RepID=A0A8J1UPI5_OWEFU|nr:unnamed protein product [Owenia fusiformis]
MIRYNPKTKNLATSLKILDYDDEARPYEPRYNMATGGGTLDSQLHSGGSSELVNRRGQTPWTPSNYTQRQDKCHRCAKRVYPVEKVCIKLGIVYHRQCFRCKVCGIQLTIKNFQWVDEESSSIDGDGAQREVFCEGHVPKNTARFGKDALGIQSALHAPKGTDAYNPQKKGWEYDNKALEFDHIRNLSQQNTTRTPLRTYDDFEKHGVFDAQQALEEKHKEEEDRLYKQIFEEREGAIRKMDEKLREEKEKSVLELIEYFNRREEVEGYSEELDEQREKRLRELDDVYKDKREERLKKLLAKLAMDERARVSDIVERHAQEMLLLLADKDREIQAREIDGEEFPPGTEPWTKHRPGSEAEHGDELYLPGEHSGADDSFHLGAEASGMSHERRGSNGSGSSSIYDPDQDPRHRGARRQESKGVSRSDSKSSRGRSRGSKYDPEARGSTTHWGTDSLSRRRSKRHSSGTHDGDFEEDDDVFGDEVKMREKGVKRQPSTVSSATQKRLSSMSQPGSPRAEMPFDHSVVPDVAPPQFGKEKIYDSPEIFQKLDKQAIEVSKLEHNNFTALVKALTKDCGSELEKIRAIFRWITAKDLSRLQFDQSIQSDSPLGILRGIKYGTESYHDLLKRLCSYAGMHCHIIKGYSKGAGYRPGIRIDNKHFRNQWTAVCIDGQWRFVNCNWGSRHVKARSGHDKTRLFYRCDEFYFLTDPRQHIHQHFPDDPAWQLLPRRLTLEQFERLPLLKSPFFNYGMSFVVKTSAIVHSDDGIAEVEIKMPKLVGFSCTLELHDRKMKQLILAGRTMIRTIDNVAIFTAHLPKSGKFIWDIYITDDWQSDSMEHACSFLIVCSGVRGHLPRFPNVGQFGRTPLMRLMGLAEDERQDHDPLILCKNEELFLSFEVDEQLVFSHTMKLFDSHNKSFVDQDRFAVLIQMDEANCVYAVKCPTEGFYVLSIFCTDDPKGEAMECVYKYLIDCQMAFSGATPFPKTSRRWRDCALHEPLNGSLMGSEDVKFLIESPLAVSMDVKLLDKFIPLKREGDNWEGTISTGEDAEKLMVFAKFNKSSNKLIPMLEYEIRHSRRESAF